MRDEYRISTWSQTRKWCAGAIGAVMVFGVSVAKHGKGIDFLPLVGCLGFAYVCGVMLFRNGRFIADWNDSDDYTTPKFRSNAESSNDKEISKLQKELQSAIKIQGFQAAKGDAQGVAHWRAREREIESRLRRLGA